jgi:hypothetical protein
MSRKTRTCWNRFETLLLLFQQREGNLEKGAFDNFARSLSGWARKRTIEARHEVRILRARLIRYYDSGFLQIYFYLKIYKNNIFYFLNFIFNINELK